MQISPARQRPTVKFSKNYKYLLLRRIALTIAAIPALVLVPFGLGILINAINPSATSAAGLLAVIAMASIMPSMLSMLALFVVALVTLFRKTIDPENPKPRPHLLQIWLAVVTTALPTVALLVIWSNIFKPCDPGCNIFQDPIVNPTLVGYFLMWIALGAVWINSKRPKPTA